MTWKRRRHQMTLRRQTQREVARQLQQARDQRPGREADTDDDTPQEAPT